LIEKERGTGAGTRHNVHRPPCLRGLKPQGGEDDLATISLQDAQDFSAAHFGGGKMKREEGTMTVVRVWCHPSHLTRDGVGIKLCLLTRMKCIFTSYMVYTLKSGIIISSNRAQIIVKI
jgi:hypothetical protein